MYKQKITEEFLALSKKWTENDTEGGQEKQIWNQKYWDNHKFTSIFKVDSHQLHNQGRKIKENPRYDGLCPNLFLLNCNHYADITADMMHKPFFASKFKNRGIILPSSNLRFFITCNGLGIDRHVTACVHEIFEKARILELQKRPTQGLPWRIVEQSGMSWESLKNSKGLFRSIRGLSRTHTRSLYKSTTYRKGWMMMALKDLSEDKAECLSSLSENKWINMLSGCKWCSNKDNVKGNRYHALLFCKDRKLSKFRDNMNMLLEQRLHSLVQLIKKTQNTSAASIFLDEIERTMKDLHVSAMGREVISLQSLYRSREQWMEEEGITTEKELMDGEIPIYGHLFGFLPLREDGYTSDKMLSPAMCIPLGIVPRELDKQIQAVSKNIYNLNCNREECQRTIEEYEDRWKEIKEIGIARTVGLHRITGIVSAEYEKAFAKQFNIKTSVAGNEGKTLIGPGCQQQVVQDTPNASEETELSQQQGKGKRKIGIQANQRSASHNHNKTSGIATKRRKYCSGITCNTGYKIWNFDFKKSQIESEKKQCQRCSRHLTAMKHGISNLEMCRASKKVQLVQDLVTHMDDNANSINFLSISKKLEELQQAEQAENTNSIKVQGKISGKRRGLRDDQKAILKTINTSITRLTNTSDNPKERICEAIGKLKETHSQMDRFLKDDLQQTKRINKRMLSISCDKKNIERTKKIRLGRENEEKHEAEQDGRKDLVTEEIAHTLGLNQWMYSYTMDRAIKFIRDVTPGNVFIANSYISSLLKNWNPQVGWQKIAEAFRIPDVILRKPIGTYIIPIFTGDNLQGHWSVAVVSKQVNQCRSWMLDSLGNANMMEKEVIAIKSIFSKARRKCKWMPTTCRRQSEVECGPRSIKAMVSIVQELTAGSSIEEAIEKATLMHIDEKDYDSKSVRETAADCLILTEECLQRDRIRETAVRACIRNIRRRENCRRVRQQGFTEEGIIELLD